MQSRDPGGHGITIAFLLWRELRQVGNGKETEQQQLRWSGLEDNCVAGR